jgi:hypothetical protein
MTKASGGNPQILLYQADCRTIIPMLDYDSVVTDPWYGASSVLDERKDGDGYEEWLHSWFPLLRRRMNANILMTVGRMNVGVWARIGQAPGFSPFGCLLAWHKPMGGWEPVLGWGDVSGPDWFRTGPDEIDEKGYRAKPLEWAVEMVSRVPGRVLDPLMGKGVVGLACKKLGREFIGIEHDPEIFKVARERLTAGGR